MRRAFLKKYLTDEKHSSANTLSSYMRDIRQLATYIDEHTELTLTTATADELSEYIEWARGKGKIRCDGIEKHSFDKVPVRLPLHTPLY